MALYQKDKYKSSIGFTDLLFNLLVGFVFLFVVAFILINPITKKSDAPKKAEYLVIIEWPSEWNDDVDLYVKDPRGIIVSFRNKFGGLLHLEKDDLGFSNDQWTDESGQTHIIPINREVVTIRGVQNGRYEVAFHVYSIKSIGSKEAAALVTTPRIVTATLIKLNPYREVMKVQVLYLGERGQVLTLFNFDIDDKKITVDTEPNDIVLEGSSSHRGEGENDFIGGIGEEGLPSEYPPSPYTSPDRVAETNINSDISFTFGPNERNQNR
tara:strand:+ start:494 stop:1297 length:804 start_codon:yes stop_codon:yes gene_type:complete